MAPLIFRAEKKWVDFYSEPHGQKTITVSKNVLITADCNG
jgi:hypothetical protein